MSSTNRESDQLSIEDAARILHVNAKTLRRWEEAGRLIPERTAGGHRRYTKPQLKAFAVARREEKHRPHPDAFLPIQTQQIVSIEQIVPDVAPTIPLIAPIAPTPVAPRHFGRRERLMVGLLCSLILLSLQATNTLARFATIYVPALQTKAKTVIAQKTAKKSEVRPTVLGATDAYKRFRVNIDTQLNENLGVVKNASIGGTLSVDGDLNVAGNTILSPGTLTIDSATIIVGNLTGESLTVGGETVSDFSGTGIQVSGGSLQTILGTTIASGEIEDGAVTENKLASSNDAVSGYVLTYNPSISGFTWVDPNTTGSFITAGGLITPIVSTNNVSIGGTTNLAKLSVIGDSDEVQFLVRANSAQTNDIVRVEDSSGSVLASIDPAGRLSFADTGLVDLSNIDSSTTTRGLILPQTTDCSSATAQGQFCWDSDNRYLTVGTGSGTTVVTTAASSFFSLVGDTGTSETISGGDNLQIVGGTNGIDTVASSADILTLNLDTTEIGSSTFGTGSGYTWLFDASAGTDTSIAFGDNTQTLTAGTITLIGNSNLRGTISNSAGNVTIGDVLDISGNVTVTSGNTLTLAGLTTASGVLYTNSSGTISQTAQGSTGTVLRGNGSGAPTWGGVDLTVDITGLLPIANGGTNGNATPTAGAIAYGTGTAYAFNTPGSTGECLVSGGIGAPTWTDCALVSGTHWNENAGSISLKNNTLDLLIGGTSTSSAIFAFTNVTSGTPTASIAGSTGALALKATGVIETTNNQTLLLGGATTGNILLSAQNGSGLVGINTLLPRHTLDVAGSASISGTLAVAGNFAATGSARLSGGATIANGASITGGLTTTNGQTFSGGLNNSGAGISNAGAITGATGLTSSGTITFSAFSTGIVKANGSGILSSSALSLTSDVTGVLGTTNGGTGLSSYTTGDLIFASAANTLSTLPLGANGQVLTVATASGLPAWASIAGAGGLCSECIVSNPNSTQSITPGTATATGLQVRQASGGSVDIFNVTTTDGTTKYLRVSSTGSVIAQSELSVTPASAHTLKISPATASSTAFTGTLTTADLDANRTWTLPNVSGEVCLTTGNCAGTSAGLSGSGTTNYLTRFSSQYVLTDSQLYDNGTYVGIGTASPAYKLDVNGTLRVASAALLQNNLAVSGGATISGTLQASGATNFYSTVGITGNTTVGGTLGVTGATTVNSTLNVTGDVTFDTDAFFVNTSTHRVGINTLSPANTFSIGSGSEFQVSSAGAIASSAGYTGVGNFAITGTGTFGTGTGAISLNGSTTIASGKTLTIASLNTAGALVYTNASGTLGVTSQGIAGDCLVSAGSGTPVWGSCSAAANNQWTTANGAIYTTNTSFDLLLGGTASASAKFAFLNVAGGTPTASISGSVAGAGLSMTGDGTISTTKNTSLALNPNGGRVGVGTSSPSTLLTLVGSTPTLTIQESANSNYTAKIRVNYNSGDSVDFLGPFGYKVFQYGNTSDSDSLALYSNNLERVRISNLGNVGIGTTTPGSKLTVSGNVQFSDFTTVNGIFYATSSGQLTQTAQGSAHTFLRGNGASAPSWSAIDIATADITGTLAIANGGTNGTATPTAGAVAYGTGTAYAFSLAGSGGQCLVSGGSGSPVWSSCAVASGQWVESAGSLATGNSTWDVLFGGTASTSAKFAFLNVNSGTPTASISGSSAGNALTLTGDGTISTTKNRSLALNPTGGNVGIGTSSPDAQLQISGVASQASPSLRVVGATSQVGSLLSLKLGASASQELITGLSSSDVAVFKVTNTGKVFIENTSLYSPSIGGSGTGGLQFTVSGNNGGHTFPLNYSSTYTKFIDADSNPVLYVRGSAAGSIGLVGLGTATPASPLHVYGAYAGAAAATIDQRNSGDILTASASGSTKMVLTNAGNLGIGTTSPGATLEVAGNVYLSSGAARSILIPASGAGVAGRDLSINAGDAGTGGGAAIGGNLNLTAGTIFKTAAASGWGGNVNITAGQNSGTSTPVWGGDINFLTGQPSSVRMFISGGGSVTAGNVGIGTTSPSGKLEVVGAGTSVVDTNESTGLIIARSNTTYGADVGPQIRLSGEVGSGGAYGTSYAFGTLAGRKENATAGNYAGYLQFNTTASSSTLSERMRITSTGNVGIGTSSPAVSLHLGTTGTSVQQLLTSAQTNASSVVSSIGSALNSINFSNYPTARYAQIDFLTGTTNYYNGGQIAFKTNRGPDSTISAPTEAMRIDNNGLVGIGTTTPTALLHVNGGYGANDAFTVNQTLSGNIFSASASGVTKMVLTNAGNLGIGTSTPTSPLTVNGDALASNYYTNGSGTFGSSNADAHLYFGQSNRISPTGGTNFYYGSGYYSQPAHQFSGGSATNMVSLVRMSSSQATKPVLLLTGATGQTGDLTRWQDVNDNTLSVVNSSGFLGIGTTAPASNLHVSGQYAGNALATFNQTSASDILTASASGVTKFTVGNTGDITTAGDIAVNGGDITTTAAAFNVANAATTLNLGSTNITRTINLGTGTGADTINIGTGATGADTITIGNNASRTALNFTSGTGAQTFSSANVTGGTTASSFVFNSSALTTGTGLYLSANALTTGTGMSITSTSTALTSGKLGSFDWSPGSATTATGDLFNINIGTNGSTTGNLFSISDTGSLLFSVSESKITSALPHEFTAAGDVSFGYDILMTNQTTANIRSLGPLTLEAGESFESNSLTLRAFNSGDIVLDTPGNAIISSTDPAMVFDTTTATDTDFWAGVIENADSTDNDYFQIGDGTVPGTNAFLTLDTVGNMGLGTSTPTSNLHVTGTYGNNALAVFNQTGSGDIFSASASGTTKMTLTNAGNLGIGTSSPSQLLSVGSSSQFTVDSSGIATIASPSYLQLNRTNNTAGNEALFFGTDIGLRKTATTSDFAIDYKVGSTWYTGFTLVNASGNIGIGTTAPTALLHVNGGYGGNDAFTVNQTLSGNILSASASGTTKMVLTNAGNLGIGTSTPASNLHVSGQYGANALATFNQTSASDILTASASGVTKFTVANNGDVATAGDIAVNGGDITTTAAAFNVANAATTLNLGSTNITRTINLGTGTGADTINIGTGGTTADTITIGNSASTTSLAFNSGTGAQTFTSQVVSGSTTTSGFVFDATAITSGTGLYVVSDSVTTGNLAQIATSTGADTLTSGNLLKVSSDLANSTFTGNLAYIDWSPDGSTEIFNTSADLLQINAGQYANVGTLLNISDNGSSIFSVSQSQIISALPHQFSAAGDLSLGYDMQFTNQTASSIKTYAPLTLDVGESFESNNLTLRTYNSGNVIVDLGATAGKMSIGANITPVSLLHVSSLGTAGIGKALAIFDQDESQEIITASASGTTRFTVNAAGNTFVTLRSTATSALCHVNNGAGYDEITDCSGSVSADYMEMYPTVASASMGTIMRASDTFTTTTDGRRIAKLTPTAQEYESAVIGIVSDSSLAGDFNSVGHNVQDGDNPLPIALNGRVPVRVTIANGVIHTGDLLATSSIPGVAMKATKAGHIIGTALEDYTQSGEGQVMLFVNNSWYDPDLALSSTGNIAIAQGSQEVTGPQGLISRISALAEGVIGKLRAGKVTSDEIETKNLTLDGVRIQDVIATMIASSSATTSPLPDSASISAMLAAWSSQNSTSSGILSADAIFANEYLNVTGTASITNASISNVAVIGSTLALDHNSISLLDSGDNALYIQPVATGSVRLFGNMLSLSSSGAAFASDVRVDGTLTTAILGIATQSGKLSISSLGSEVASIDASGSAQFASLRITANATASASVGSTKIVAGQTSITIETTQVKAGSLIYITPTSNTGNKVPFIAGQTDGTFTIAIDGAIGSDITLNWWIIN